jgi:hypothetical protein
MEQSLYQLPNKDLWRGYTPETAAIANLENEKVPEGIQDPLNKAVAECLAVHPGSREVTCKWCGQQGDEKWIRKHLPSSHPSVVNPMSDAEVAVAALAQAQAAKK